MKQKLNSKELRSIDPQTVDTLKIKRKPIYLILESVYDTYNIGGLFRLADAIAASKMYLCGQMEIPPHHKIAKASVGTYKVVPWEYYEKIEDAINALRKTVPNIKIIAVEQSKSAISIDELSVNSPIGLILGNETYGVTPETLKLADQIVEIPMWGINKSLNVIVSAAIVSYFIAIKSEEK